MRTPVLTTRERVLEAAVELTSQLGWSQVTMARLADEVGVSRQTVYNEIGSKPRLAEAIVLRELDRFLGLVTAAFDTHPDTLTDAIRAAAGDVLDAAQDNPLLRAVASATHGADTELLPLLTTHSAPLLGAAKAILVERAAAYDAPVPADRLDVVVDLVVRLVLSHVMQPSAAPAETAADIAWMVGRVVGTGA